ncbi:hypothetical protein J3R83DRAFT_5741, partial [Lanmaoa asiatica]
SCSKGFSTLFVDLGTLGHRRTRALEQVHTDIVHRRSAPNVHPDIQVRKNGVTVDRAKWTSEHNV